MRGIEDDELRETIRDAMGLPPEELHTRPEVRRISAIGEKHPEKLTLAEIQSLCGEIQRHIERMETGK